MTELEGSGMSIGRAQGGDTLSGWALKKVVHPEEETRLCV